MKLKFAPKYYYPENMDLSGAPSEKEYREEYMRLRDVARKRRTRFEGAGFKSSKFVKNTKDLRPQSELSIEHVMFELSYLKKALTAKTGNLKGYREYLDKTAESLNARTNSIHLDQSNVEKFGEFMGAWRNLKYAALVPSETVAELYANATNLGVTPSNLVNNFSTFLQHESQIEEMADSGETPDLDTQKDWLDYLRGQEKEHPEKYWADKIVDEPKTSKTGKNTKPRKGRSRK